MFHRYAYAWITILFFAVSLGLHWWFAWADMAREAAEQGSRLAFGDWAVAVARETFENWQSEFLQLLWQVVGLAYFLYAGSPSSKENDDRLEAKIDLLLRQLPEGGRAIAEIDARYLRHGGHPQPHGAGQH